MSSLFYQQWEQNPPTIETIVQVTPQIPVIPLTGSTTTRMNLDKFLKYLEDDMKKQKGHYFEYVWGYYKSLDEADIFTLQDWRVCRPDDGNQEAIIIMYYAPINMYLTLKKHFGEEDAQEYLDKIAARSAAITALADALD